MDPVTWLWLNLDPILIAPYRLISDPVWGWWLGSLVLAGWAVFWGELTLALVFRLNRRYVEDLTRETQKRNQQAINALKAGDKAAYRGINKLANEAHGKAFFLQIAMGASSLWPAFLAAGWLELRFGDVPIVLPGLEGRITYLAGFVPLYLAVRLAWGLAKKRLGLGERSRLLWKTAREGRSRKKNM